MTRRRADDDRRGALTEHEMIVQERAIEHYGKRWHFEKRLSVDTLVQIIGVAIVLGGPILYWGRAMEARVLALEIGRVERDRTEAMTRTDSQQQSQIVAKQLERLDEKVTNLQIAIGQLVRTPVPTTVERAR